MAQQSTGRFGSRIIASDTTEMAGGGMLALSHYHQVTFADDPSHPLNNQAADWVGQFLMAAEGNSPFADGNLGVWEGSFSMR